MNLREKYGGVVVPVVTPVSENGKIDLLSVEKIIEYLIDNRCKPFVLGTTGEAVSLTVEQKKEIVLQTVKTTNNKTSVFAGISGTCLENCIYEGNVYAESGVSALVSTVPVYYPLNDAQIISWFEKLADSLSVPLFLYNIPSTTHLSIPVSCIEVLSQHPNIAGIKDSEKNTLRAEELLNICKNKTDFIYLVGSSALSLHGLKLGAAGIVPAAANFCPELYSALLQAALKEDWDTAEDLQIKTDELSMLFLKNRGLSQSLPALKVILGELGLCQPFVIPPLQRMSEPEESLIKKSFQVVLSQKSFNVPFKPTLAITLGDPAGIGPEITLKALADPDIYRKCNPLVIGNAAILKQTSEKLGIKTTIHVVSEPKNALFEFGKVDVIDIELKKPVEINPGIVSAIAGDVAFRSIHKAIELAMRNEVDATVTNPIHKKAINLAGYNFSGHTEIYAHYTNSPSFAMLLADENLRVIHVSTHVSLRKACELVKEERVLEVIEIMDKGLKKMGIMLPRIGVAGLNPHAGDDGLFGDEEASEIIPAIKRALEKGINVSGPFPPDTLYSLAAGGKFDGCVAMYHDQGHIPFKYSGFKWNENLGKMETVKGVNITLGLPVIRTSVDHGTAFEIAGKGIASCEALLNAIEYAVKFAKTKNKVN